MIPTRHTLTFAVCLFAMAAIHCQAADDKVDFNRDIRPILADRCFACHGPDEKVLEAELRLDQEDSVFSSERKKPLIVRGKPAESELYRRITATDDDQMPPRDVRKRLTDRDKDLIRRWIEQGAKWATHWAYISPQKFEPPGVSHEAFVHNDIDRFILRRLKDEGLAPSQVADDVTLLRRIHFDLIGLPPAPEDVAEYVKSSDPRKYEKLVDRLLDSKHFGERLAIYWLDVVRFADSNGYHSDEPRKIAPYRDYVIQSFNANKPYDQFVVEQLAGDLIPEAGIEQQVASGFNMLLQTTSEGGAQAKEYIAKYAADRVRNTSQIFLGSTMGCAECHNHKFDPFTQQDFYSFAAFFADIQQPAVGNPANFPVMTDEAREKIAAIDASLAELTQKTKAQTPELTVELDAWVAKTGESVNSTPSFGPWHIIGPFAAASFDEAHAKAFIPETETVDLGKAADKLKWRKEPKLEDGKPFTLRGLNSATYLFRTVTVAEATKVELSLGSDDSIIVWLNGQKIHENKILRAVAPNQDKASAELQAGENQLLFKVSNGGGGYGFYFNATKLGLPPNIAAIVKAEKRTDAQQKALEAYFRTIAPSLKPLRDQIAKLQGEKKQINDTLPRTMMTKVGTPRMVRVLPRGNWLDESGEVVQPAIPAFLGSLETGERRANRLDLAKWVVDPGNPLTARTFANRAWKLFFGHGLATPLDDLGRQGTVPTHPELLDWMAIEFVDSGWDIKHMVRLLVTSGTYRQSSLVPDTLNERDPYNQLYARQSRFRLDAEFVRDNALAISGLLVTKIGGRSVYPYQPAGYWRHMNFPRRTWPGDKGDELYRRSLYTWWQRMFLHPGMVAFDAPSREECTVERPRSNIPQQALVLLNDPTYVEAARSFGGLILKEGGATPDARINWAFQRALSRPATDRETAIIRRVFEKHLTRYQSDEDAARQFLSVGTSPMPAGMNLAELAAWTSVARIILNLHETITRS